VSRCAVAATVFGHLVNLKRYDTVQISMAPALRMTRFQNRRLEGDGRVAEAKEEYDEIAAAVGFLDSTCILSAYAHVLGLDSIRIVVARGVGITYR
jgi:hypothetical protein